MRKAHGDSMRRCVHCGAELGTVAALTDAACLHYRSGAAVYTCSRACRDATGLRAHWQSERCAEPCELCGVTVDGMQVAP